MRMTRLVVAAVALGLSTQALAGPSTDCGHQRLGCEDGFERSAYSPRTDQANSLPLEFPSPQTIESGHKAHDRSSNFEMDADDPLVLILIGHPALRLRLQRPEVSRQRFQSDSLKYSSRYPSRIASKKGSKRSRPRTWRESGWVLKAISASIARLTISTLAWWP